MKENICKPYICKELLSKIYNKLIQFSRRKIRSKNGQWTWIDISQKKKNTSDQQVYDKELSVTSHQENAN